MKFNYFDLHSSIVNGIKRLRQKSLNVNIAKPKTIRIFCSRFHQLDIVVSSYGKIKNSIILELAAEFEKNNKDKISYPSIQQLLKCLKDEQNSLNSIHKQTSKIVELSNLYAKRNNIKEERRKAERKILSDIKQVDLLLQLLDEQIIEKEKVCYFFNIK